MVRGFVNEAPERIEFRRLVLSSAWLWVTLAASYLLANTVAGLGLGTPQADLEQIAGAIQSGRLNEAEVALDSLLKSHPDSVDAYRLLGAVFEREEKFQQAESVLQKAAGLSAKLSGRQDPQVLFLLCQTEFDLKKKTEALSLAHQLEALADDNPQAHYALGRLLRENGVAQEASQELGTAARLAPGNPAVTTELIVAYLDQGRGEEAEALLKAFIASASY